MTGVDVQATLPMQVPVERRPAPSRDVSGGFYWGVDTDTYRTAIAWTDGTTYGARTAEADKRLVGVARADDLVERTMDLARELAGVVPPLVVWVERIAVYGDRQAQAPTYYACGNAMTAIYAALKDRFAFPVWVEDVPVSTARKRAVGSGRVKKPQVLAWANELEPSRAWSFHEADALVMAVAAYRSVSFEEAVA